MSKWARVGLTSSFVRIKNEERIHRELLRRRRSSDQSVKDTIKRFKREDKNFEGKVGLVMVVTGRHRRSSVMVKGTLEKFSELLILVKVRLCSQ